MRTWYRDTDASWHHANQTPVGINVTDHAGFQAKTVAWPSTKQALLRLIER
jgi:hypothetical protein